MMNKTMLRTLALLLALLMTLVTLAACNSEQTPDGGTTDGTDSGDGTDGGDDGTEDKDPATDGVFDLNDYDPQVNYEPDDFLSLTISDYLTLGRYEGLTLTLNEEDITITDELLDNRIDTILAENHPDAKITDRVVAWNDTVVLDYVGTKDGVAFSGGTASNQTIAVTEENGYIPGFVDGIVGLEIGVATPVKVTFPENYGVEELNGQEVTFTFTVHYIVGSPELTDDFVTDYTEGEYTTADAYREAIKAEMADEAYELAVRVAFWDKIAENAAVKKYPENTVLYYYDYYYQLYTYYASQYGLTIDIYLMYFVGSSTEAMFQACCDMVKTDLVYYAVFAAKGYEYTDEEYQRALDLYTDTNWETLNAQLESAGKDTYTKEEAREYFDTEMKSTLILQTLEEIAYNDLVKDYKVEVIPAEDDTTADQ